MSENMRERVARVIFDAGEKRMRANDPEWPVSTWDETVARAEAGNEHWAYVVRCHRGDADAALDAMREPTRDMLTAGVIQFYEEAPGERPRRGKTERIYRAMIDAAKGGP